jgi:hypothetical protein
VVYCFVYPQLHCGLNAVAAFAALGAESIFNLIRRYGSVARRCQLTGSKWHSISGNEIIESAFCLRLSTGGGRATLLNRLYGTFAEQKPTICNGLRWFEI